MNNYYSMEKWYLAELLLLLAEDDAITAADMIKAMDNEEEQNDD